MIKNLLIDLDNTLLDFDWAERKALTETLSRYGIPPEERLIESYSRINAQHWARLEKGEITRDELKISRFKCFLEAEGLNADYMEMAACYAGELGKGHRFISGAKEMLEDLYLRYDLYLASNGLLSVQQGRIKSSGIGKYFKGFFISQEVGFDKPDKRYFDFFFNAVPKASTYDTAILGDSLTSDIQGGLNAGIVTIWYNPAGKDAFVVKPLYQVRKLTEVPKLLKTL